MSYVLRPTLPGKLVADVEYTRLLEAYSEVRSDSSAMSRCRLRWRRLLVTVYAVSIPTQVVRIRKPNRKYCMRFRLGGVESSVFAEDDAGVTIGIRTLAVLGDVCRDVTLLAEVVL